jgi:hypothetical protein
MSRQLDLAKCRGARRISMAQTHTQ